MKDGKLRRWVQGLNGEFWSNILFYDPFNVVNIVRIDKSFWLRQPYISNPRSVKVAFLRPTYI